ncbi:MAG: hypothetical protein IIW17_04695, partial [Clostridia bacterium]|nr:hypothetical protein [Clostridia bacterium]
IEWVYDANAATKFATLHKKAGICSKSNKFLLFSRYFRSPMWVSRFFTRERAITYFGYAEILAPTAVFLGFW